MSVVLGLTRFHLQQMLACWAKLAGGNEPSSYHPLLCHMVDVAIVAREMWLSALSPRVRRETARALGFGEDQHTAGLWCAFLAGLHDLGKASPAFQLQVDRVRADVRKRLQHAGLRVSPQYDTSRTPHGTITAATLPDVLKETFGLAPLVASRIGVVVGGHHGVFPTSAELLRVRSYARGRKDWDAFRHALANQLAATVGVPGNNPPRKVDNAASMLLAGLVSVADWVGSNTDFFRYAHPQSPADLAAYARDMQEQAKKALSELGWRLLPPPHSVRPFRELFQRISPNALQRTVESLAPGLDEPGLVIIEAPMGEGKTEAAMYLADHWAASIGQQGCYFALPTQATSNQMFGRVRDFLSRRYTGEQVQLQLLHGHASLSSEFQLLRDKHDRTFAPGYEGVEQDAGHSGVVAAEWFTYRKRGLLSPFGVGTVDQALLAALQTRHVFVRLFGLAHKTVIVDEVHAYDTYMTTLLERLLEWLAALGSSVVLLSATLPKLRSQALLAAYQRGLGKTARDAVFWGGYPRVTWVSASSQPISSTVKASSIGTKRISLEWTDGSLPAEGGGRFALGELLAGTLGQGGCAAVICNTVRRAQEVYRALKPYFRGMADDGEPELDLLHAQYLFEDREAREVRALTRFGKPDGKVPGDHGEERPVRRPQRAVLVATQVIEQSLDLDFDLMVTEMAPADFLLQRAGRLHRHERSPRPHGLERPRLLVCRPGMDGDVPAFAPGTRAVYDHHVLLRSWLALRDRDMLRVPEDVEAIVEEVYDDQRQPDGLPKSVRREWKTTRESLEAANEREREEAKDRWLKAPSYPGQLWRLTATTREEDAPDFHKAHQALTRLAPPSVSVVFLYGTMERASFGPGQREPLDLRNVPSIDVVKRLLRRSATISDKRVVFQLLRQSPPESWRKTPLLKNHRPVFLDHADTSTVDRYRIALDVETGVVVSRSD